MFVGQLSANHHQRQSNIAKTARNPDSEKKEDKNDNELPCGHGSSQRHYDMK